VSFPPGFSPRLLLFLSLQNFLSLSFFSSPALKLPVLFPAPLTAFPTLALPLNFLSGTVGPRTTGDSTDACKEIGPASRSARAATWVGWVRGPVSRAETQAVPSGVAVMAGLEREAPSGAARYPAATRRGEKEAE